MFLDENILHTNITPKNKKYENQLFIIYSK
jgi:hypothetical protein